MAEYFHIVLVDDGFAEHFRTIFFTIPTPDTQMNGNYRVFRGALARLSAGICKDTEMNNYSKNVPINHRILSLKRNPYTYETTAVLDGIPPAVILRDTASPDAFSGWLMHLADILRNARLKGTVAIRFTGLLTDYECVQHAFLEMDQGLCITQVEHIAIDQTNILSTLDKAYNKFLSEENPVYAMVAQGSYDEFSEIMEEPFRIYVYGANAELTAKLANRLLETDLVPTAPFSAVLSLSWPKSSEYSAVIHDKREYEYYYEGIPDTMDHASRADLEQVLAKPDVTCVELHNRHGSGDKPTSELVVIPNATDYENTRQAEALHTMMGDESLGPAVVYAFASEGHLLLTNPFLSRLSEIMEKTEDTSGWTCHRFFFAVDFDMDPSIAGGMYPRGLCGSSWRREIEMARRALRGHKLPPEHMFVMGNTKQ